MTKPEASEPRYLDRWAVAVCWLIGVGGLGAGGVAVFKTTNGLGSAVLIVVGLIVLVIALARRVPTSLRAGDYSADWGSAALGAAVGAKLVAENVNAAAETATDTRELANAANATASELQEAAKLPPSWLVQAARHRTMQRWAAADFDALFRSALVAAQQTPTPPPRPGNRDVATEDHAESDG